MRVQTWISRVLAAVLVGSHIWLLGSQWQAGRLTEPGLLLRWAAAVAIAIALTAVYRSGASFFSRKSIIIWILAALLHAPAVVSRTGLIVSLNGVPEATITLVAQTLAVAGAASLAAFLFAALLRRRALSAPRAWAFVSVLGAFTLLSDGFSAVVSARPPPVQA